MPAGAKTLLGAGEQGSPLGFVLLALNGGMNSTAARVLWWGGLQPAVGEQSLFSERRSLRNSSRIGNGGLERPPAGTIACHTKGKRVEMSLDPADTSVRATSHGGKVVGF